MVVTYNLYNPRTETFCLLRKEWMLADLNKSLVLPFLFRTMNTTIEGFPQHWKKQKPGSKKEVSYSSCFYIQSLGFSNLSLFLKPKHLTEICFCRGGWQKGWLNWDKLRNHVLDFTTHKLSTLLIQTYLGITNYAMTRIRILMTTGILFPTDGAVLWADCCMTVIHIKHWKNLSTLVYTQEVHNLQRRASNENLLCTRSFDEGKRSLSSLFLWIKLKKPQSFSIAVCFSLRGVIKTDCSGWFTGTQVKTIKN